MRRRIIFFIARLIPNLVGVVTTAVLTRLLEPGEYGLYALGLTIILFLTMGVFEWLGITLLRMAFTAEDPRLFFGMVVTCFCVLCVFSVLVAMSVLFLADLENYAFLAMACLGAAFAAAWFELKQRLQMSELRDADYFWSSAGRCVITLILVCGAALVYRSAPLIIVSMGIGSLLGTIVRRDPRLSFRNMKFELKLSRKLFRFGFPLSISIGLATIMGGTIDKWLLQGMLGSQAVGLFTAATMVTQVPLMALAGGIGPTAFSMAVQALSHSLEESRAQLAQNFIILLGVVLPAATGIVVLSHNLADLMVGAAYWHSVIVLAPWLAAAAVLSSLRAFYFDTAFQLAHQNSRLIWTMLIAVVVNVALDILLIPKLGELGAAIGIFGASCTGLVVTGIVSISVFRLPLPFVNIAKVVGSTAIMYLVLRQVAHFSGLWAFACQVGMGLLIYLSGLIALNVLGVRSRLVLSLTRQLPLSVPPPN